MTNIHRLPTKTETFFGATFALLLSCALGYLFWYVFHAAPLRPQLLTPAVIAVLAVLGAIFAWSSSLFLRIVFGSPELPSFKGQSMLGWFMVICGVVLCCGSLLVPTSRPMLYIAQGITAISLGALWVSQARKRTRARA